MGLTGPGQLSEIMIMGSGTHRHPSLGGDADSDLRRVREHL